MVNSSFRTLLAMLGLICLAACHRGPADLTTAPLAGAHIGGHWTLTSQTGQPVHDTDFTGKFRIMYFGYTSCPDACPTDMQHLMAGYRKFVADHPQEASKLQPLFVSVDPARDTPSRLQQFTAAFDSHLLGLTGNAATIATVAKEYAAVYQIGKPNAAGQYLVDHSRVAILYGPHGEPVMILSQDGTADKIADELAMWVR